MSILVLGSLNIDLVAGAARLPRPGETVLGDRFLQAPGGKGANQAAAAARLGGRVRIHGRVGGDDFGRHLIGNLDHFGIDTSGVAIDIGCHSGLAMIAVGPEGQNQIVVIPGANGRVRQEDAERLAGYIEAGDLLLLQGEIPAAANLTAARQARAVGARVLFDPAPVSSDFLDELIALADIITPNETEAARITGLTVTDPDSGLAAAAQLTARGAGTAIITLGAQGVAVAGAVGLFHAPAFAVEVIDTVAAGDAFNGALAVALDEGRSFHEALRWAQAAGALAATRRGAQPSLPSRAALLEFLDQQP